MTYTAAELENFPYAKEGKFIYRTFNKDVPKACRFFLELDSFEAIWVLVWLGRRNPGFLVRFVETLSDFA